MEIAIILKDAYGRMQKIAESRQEAAKPKEVTPDDPLKEARLAVKEGNHRRASEMYAKVLENKPDSVEAIEGKLTAMRHFSRDHNQMERLCRSLLRAKPESAEGFKCLAQVLLAQGRFEDALVNAELAVEFSEGDPELQKLLQRIRQENSKKEGIFKRFFN